MVVCPLPPVETGGYSQGTPTALTRWQTFKNGSKNNKQPID
jgi:hypothetical protein